MSENEMREDVVDGCLVHESSYVDKGAKVGEGTRIWHFCHIMDGADIGQGCSIGQNVVVMAGVKLGDGCKVQNNVSLYTGVACEEDVFLGPSCVFTNVVNPRSHISRKDEYKTTIVRKGATVGANATIVCGNTLGRYSFIGAGAVVTKDVPDYAIVCGNPSKVQGWMCECGIKMDFSGDTPRHHCNRCGMEYSFADGLVSPVADL